MPSREFVYIKSKNKRFAHQSQFLISKELWMRFKMECGKQEVTASEILREFIDECVVSNIPEYQNDFGVEELGKDYTQAQFAVCENRWESFKEHCNVLNRTPAEILRNFVLNYVYRNIDIDVDITVNVSKSDFEMFKILCGIEGVDANDEIVNFIKQKIENNKKLG